jgi:hypothetical protein
MLDTIKPLALGLLVFIVIITGGTYILQDNLWLVKLPESFPGMSKTDAIYTHWAVVLILLPIITGTILKMLNTPMAWLVIILGTLATVGILYPIYSSRFWAEAPTPMYIATYCVMVMGITYFANQPLKATFSMAFSLFLRKGDKKAKPAAKPASKPSAATRSRMSQTQRIRTREHGDIVALVELLVGVVSLVLSVFSIFFLGQGG